jgi:CopG family transcriptional regulator / antitoxin EndoAI
MERWAIAFTFAIITTIFPQNVREMYQNINIHLPDDTLVEIERLAPKSDSPETTLRERSRFINEAVIFYIKEKNKQALRDLVKEGAIARSERDLALAQEWFVLDEEIRPIADQLNPCVGKFI